MRHEHSIRPASFLFFFLLLPFSWAGTRAYGGQFPSEPDTIRLKDSLYHISLPEVWVVARENHRWRTTSVIDQKAIQHVQAYSLTDLMQLLPGGTTQNVTFRKSGQFTIRELAFSTTNALGTGISIDGVRITTNDDLRENTQPAGYSGPDTREINTAQIESVEVIRGIPSARHGDITSGMVIVRTRKNLRPYSFSVHLTPDIHSFAADKSWKAGSNGIFSLNAEYLRSNAFNSDEQAIYNRMTLTSSYIWRGDLTTLESGFTGCLIVNDNPDNLRLRSGESISSGNRTFRFRFAGTRRIDGYALSRIDWNAHIGWGHARREENLKYSGVYNTATDARTDGERIGFFIPAQYWQRYSLESDPLNASASVGTQFDKSGDRWNSRTSIGVEWRTEGNRGSGKTYDYHTPDLPSQKGYDFQEIPFMHQYAAYLEEYCRIHRFTAEIGVRLSGVSLQDRNFGPVIEPRLNLSFLALRRPDALFRLLRLRAGAGILRKMPTLGYLYREPRFFNIQSYRYRDEASGHGLAVITTARFDFEGRDRIELPRNIKAEAGLSGEIGSFAFDITLFYERLSNGFGLTQTARPIPYRSYTPTSSPGLIPEYRNGEVEIDGVPVGYTADTLFQTSNGVANTVHTQKSGVEFVLRTGNIAPLATTFILDGAWLAVRNENRGLTAVTVSQSSHNRSYPMCAFYESGRISVGKRLNTTLRAVTEIKALKLITTLALQAVWFEQQNERLKKNHSYYRENADGKRVSDGLDKDAETPKYQMPDQYMDTQGRMHPFTDDLADRPEYAPMIRSVYSRTFLKDTYAPYFLINLRVTKEIGKYTRLTFFANNILDTDGIRYSHSTGSNKQMNPATFFGAELQITLN